MCGSVFLSIWDSDKDTIIDYEELVKATQALGYLGIARELLELCDLEATGGIKISEIVAALQLKAEGDESQSFFQIASRISQVSCLAPKYGYSCPATTAYLYQGPLRLASE